MKKIFVYIKNSLNERFIISQAELASFLMAIFLQNSITDEGAEMKFKRTGFLTRTSQDLIKPWATDIFQHNPFRFISPIIKNSEEKALYSKPIGISNS